MKKTRVNFILVLVVSALLALLLIQAFQTAQLYDRKSNEFSSRFSTTLDRIALKHEKAEDIRRYMLLANKDFSGQYKDILKEEFQHLISTQESISIQDTTIFEDGKMENYLIIKGKSYDSISGLTAEQRVLARDVRQLRDLFNRSGQNAHKDSVQLAIQLDQRVIQQIFKKARFVNEMMVDAFRNNIYEKPEERVDVGFLDSVLRQELKNDLPERYEFCVTDENQVPLTLTHAPIHYNTQIDTTLSHRTLLYPSNPLDEDLYLHLYFPQQKSFLIMEMWAPLLVNLSLVLLIIAALILMFRTILSQNKLSEMKNDFISNMTHEFKTPISTISLACQAMNDTDMIGDENNATKPFVKMIDEENKRLSLLVERILQSATLDKGELHLKNEKILLNELIEDTVRSAQLRLKNIDGTIVMNMPHELIYVQGDKFHIANALSNLLDNAIKYSDSALHIRITLQKEGKNISISIADNGIGIKKEHLNKIFDKLYRIPTGNVHNVKGFGLGLSYVKAIIEKHGWTISVNSKYGQGSEFIIRLKQE